MTTNKKTGPLLCLVAFLFVFAVFAAYGLSSAGKNESVALKEISFYEDNASSRVEIKLSGKADYKVVGSSPTKIVVDLYNTVTRSKINNPLKHDNVKMIRAAQNSTAPDIVRVVIELKEPFVYNVYPAGDGKLIISIAGQKKPTKLNVESITKNALIIDLHADTPTRFYRRGISVFEGDDIQVTLPRLKKSGVKAQFFAVWIPNGKGFSYADKVIKLFYSMLERYPDDIAFAGSYQDLERNLEQGRISAFLGIEGGDAIEGELDNLDYFYSKGVRYMTITWNYSNRIADSATDSNKPHNGLSSFGESVIKRMNKLGMIVDVSHADKETVKDVLKISEDPIIASHSCCRALRDHDRNLADDQIKALCNAGGVIGINYHRTFLTNRRKAYVKDVADHIDHTLKVGGIDCVALGSDFDGGITTPADMQHAGEIHNLTRELIKRGHTRTQIDKIYGINFSRVLKDVVNNDETSY